MAPASIPTLSSAGSIRSAIAVSLLRFFSVVALLPAVDAHESCCETAAAHHEHGSRRLDAIFLSKSIEACPWLLLGLIITAALTTMKLPSESIRSFLSSPQKCDTAAEASASDRASSRLVESIRLSSSAAILGLVTPLCSCGALPLAAGFIKSGADVRSVTAFLTAAQSAGLDSAAITAGMLGWKVAAFRLAGSVVLAVGAGVAVGGGAGRCSSGEGGDAPAAACEAKMTATETVGAPSPSSCCGSGGGGEEKRSEESCCGGHDDSPAGFRTENDDSAESTCPPNKMGKGFSDCVRTSLRSLFDTFDEIWPVVILGVFVTACVEHMWHGDSLPLRPPQSPRPPPPGWDVDEDGPWDDGSSHSSFMSFLVTLLPPLAVDMLVRTSVVGAALPLQLCEHGVVSFAAALEKAGATPGTAHAFLLSAPATNAASLGVLMRAGGCGGAALRGAIGIALTAVFLSYVADLPGVLGGDDGSKIGDAVETFEPPGWFGDLSLYVCGVLLVASVARRTKGLMRRFGNAEKQMVHLKTE